MTLEVFVCPNCRSVQAPPEKELLLERYICHICKTVVSKAIVDYYELAEISETEQ